MSGRRTLLAAPLAAIVLATVSSCASPSAPRATGPSNPADPPVNQVQLSHNESKATCDEFFLFMEALNKGTGSHKHLVAVADRVLQHAVKTPRKDHLLRDTSAFVTYIGESNLPASGDLMAAPLIRMEHVCDY